MNTATTSEDRLESILDQIRVLKAKYDERAEVTGENFNVFSILDRESDEVKTHSAIIAELLNPQGSHSQGTLFLKLFLEKLLADEIPKLKCGEDDLSDEYLKEFEVGVEVSFVGKSKNGDPEQSRIDILIEKDDDCVVIENKIWAADQPRQLERYHEYATRKDTNPTLIYLTPYGTEPGEYTLGSLSKDEVVCLSYCKHIIEWVDACIKEVARIPQIRETLHQYQMLLKKLTSQPINRRHAMALKDILLKDENYNLIPDLEAAISEAKDAFQRDFWTELEEQLKAREELNIGDENLRYEVDGRAPGLTFRFSESGDENYEVVFRIADDRDQYPLYYGFALREKENHKRVAIDNAEHKKYLTQYQHSIDNGEKNWDGGWITYKYIKNPAISFTNFEFVKEHGEGNLANFKEELVKKLVGKIYDVVKKVSEQEQSAVT